MDFMKPILITYQKRVTESYIKECNRKFKYSKIYIFTESLKQDISLLSKYKKFILEVISKKDLPKKIDEVFEKEKSSIILPYFAGDSNSKYSIKVYNKMFGSNVDPKVFKMKNKMNDFLSNEIGNKKNIKISYDDLKKKKYEDLSKEIGASFILKPINAASSLLNFKISAEENFEKAKDRMKKKYQYILEEYLEGNLYAIDFYCDGKDIYLLCFSREIPFSELLEKLSHKYLEKYESVLNDEFLHFLPIRYTLGLEKISSCELSFIKKLGDKLVKSCYRGFIHLEYKIKRKDNKIGFIEWGARLGGKRSHFIEEMHNLKVENLPYQLIYKKDTSQFKKSKNIYFLKNRNIDENFIGIKTNVLKKTHVMEIFKKTPSFLNISFETFLKGFLWDYWKIKVQKIKFYVKSSPNYFIYPFHERHDTHFDYILYLDEESFKKFINNKFKILEKLIFHDYKKVS